MIDYSYALEQCKCNNEIWVSIPGYEDCYQISNLGRVRSLDRTTMDKIGGQHLNG